MKHTKPLFNEIDNKIKAKYFNLVKSGYYIRPNIFNNTTICGLCKDTNPVNCVANRKIFGNVNKTTAKILVQYFGFKIKNETKYFGKQDPIPNYVIQTFF